MKLAVTYENEMVGQHFGRTEKFKVFDIENGKITSSEIIDTNGTGHEALAPFLKNLNVDVLICGNMGMGAKTALGETGINIIAGVEGKVDEVVNEYLVGTLKSNPNVECHEHDHEEGHNCGHGGCGHH